MNTENIETTTSPQTAATPAAPVIAPADAAALIAADAPRVAEKPTAAPQTPATVATAPQPNAPQNAAPVPGVTRDSGGTAYDPLRHLTKPHPRTGRWMPRKPAKTPQNTAKATAPANAGAAKPTAATPQNTATPPPANAASAPEPWSAAERAEAAKTTAASAATPETWSAAERAEAAKTTAASAATPETATPQNTMPVATPETIAEVATNAIYTGTGVLIKSHKAARPSAAEHANIKSVTAAYLHAKGVRFVGGAALILTFVAFLLGDERRELLIERIKDFVRWKKPKLAQPAAPAAQASRPQPAAAPAAAAPLAQRPANIPLV